MRETCRIDGKRHISLPLEASIIIRFGIENVLSFREYSELSFVASSLSDEGTDLISPSGVPTSLLPAIAIYGANASGKSNVIQSLEFFRRRILNSHKESTSTSGTNRIPFLLDEDSQKRPSRYDADFIISGVRYHYGFTCNDSDFIDEWLYAFPKGRRQTWFFRRDGKFEFGKSFSGRNRTLAEFTSSKSLFISTAAQNNHELILPILNYFRDNLIYLSGQNMQLMEESLSNPEQRKMILGFLSRSDFGVSEIKIKETKLPDKSIEMIHEFMPIVQRHLGASGESMPPMPPMVNKEFELGHLGSGRKTFFLNWRLESQGTRELLSLLGPLMDAIAKGKFLIIDEIDSSLHSVVASVLIRAFASSDINGRGGQILFSTHDTNLLCSGVLRRDQIWFTEKNEEGQSSLYPLTDISTRKSDNIERGYLEGRFGAIPFVGDWRRLFEGLGGDADVQGRLDLAKPF